MGFSLRRRSRSFLVAGRGGEPPTRRRRIQQDRPKPLIAVVFFCPGVFSPRRLRSLVHSMRRCSREMMTVDFGWGTSLLLIELSSKEEEPPMWRWRWKQQRHREPEHKNDIGFVQSPIYNAGQAFDSCIISWSRACRKHSQPTNQ
jgi:hypothetical protein